MEAKKAKELAKIAKIAKKQRDKAIAKSKLPKKKVVRMPRRNSKVGGYSSPTKPSLKKDTIPYRQTPSKKLNDKAAAKTQDDIQVLEESASGILELLANGSNNTPQPTPVVTPVNEGSVVAKERASGDFQLLGEEVLDFKVPADSTGVLDFDWAEPNDEIKDTSGKALKSAEEVPADHMPTDHTTVKTLHDMVACNKETYDYILR